MSMMPVIETWPPERLPAPDGGGDGEPYCYCCLVGTCPHRLGGGHQESAITEFHGTALCGSCAQQAPRTAPSRLRPGA